MSPPTVFFHVGQDVRRREAVGAIICDIGLQEREGGLTQHAGEDIRAEVELVVAQGHGIVVHGVEGFDQRLDVHGGINNGRAIRGKSGRRGLEVETHRVALDVVTRAEQEGAGGVVIAFLLDQRGQLGVANIAGLVQVAVRVVVVQDRQRDNFARLIGVITIAIAGDTPVQRPIVRVWLMCTWR